MTAPPPDSPPVACAYCDSTDTEMIALFGQSLMVSQFYCRRCRSVFEAVRWVEAESAPPPPPEAPRPG